uniref:RRM domain-containing protein n=1 Tax=Romanomermis culicivorax TaxID=13658 RepID=A0A915L1A5_ROMCU
MADESNGNIEEGSDQQSFKRFKKDDNIDPTNPDPSIVVHVRNLNSKATEADLIEALSHFGSIAYATCMPNKRMALVEFEDIESAKNCVTYAQSNQIYVAGQPALFNFSTSKMIQRIGLECEKPSCVVVLSIYNAAYPISVDIIYQICKPHGEVQRVAILRRNMLQALVEFATIEQARKAKHALNGADIYSGCCTVKIEFARSDHVKITRNDQDQFDFTVSGGSLYEKSGPNRQGLLGPAGTNGPPQPPLQPVPPPQNMYGSGSNYDNYAPPPSGHGGGPGMYNEYENDYGYQSGGGYPPQQPFGGRMMGGGYGGPPHHSMNRNYDGDGGYNDSCVVMVYGIDQEKWNCDKLFNLLCVYGNVFRIKFMKSKPDTAMVQMGSPDQVQCAIDNLHHVTIYDQQLALRFSRQPTLHDIRDPFDLLDGQPSFKDFTHSRNNRFLTPETASRNRIVYPTNCLHWFNAPSTMTEEKMKEILSANGAPAPTKVVIFPVKSERSSSGVAIFETTEQAMEAMMLNNHTAVDSPIGKLPYIVKLAFSMEKERY